MSESTAAAEKQLPDFVDLELARRLEMAETISPDCYEALRRFGPERSHRAAESRRRLRLLRRPGLSREPDCRHGTVRTK